jgi:hypothetical protein
VLYSILIEFGVSMKLGTPIRILLNETYSKVHTGKRLSDRVPVQNCLKEGVALLPLLLNFAFNMSLGRSGKTRWD